MSGIEGVQVVPVDNVIVEKWKSLRKYRQYGPFIETEVRARQTLNAELALKMALEEGIDWLLHIDSDELFWIPQPSITSHLTSLASEEIVSARYINFEAVPHQQEVTDYFLEVGAFKKPRKLLAKQGINVEELWQERRKYFNFYNNGKSMCRVRPDMVPNDVHKWRSWQHHIHTTSFYYPCILHFSCCGYQYFESKFRKLVDNGSEATEFGVSMKDKGFSIDYDATMAYRANDLKKAMEIYQNRIMMSEEKINHYVSCGIMERIDIASCLGIKPHNVNWGGRESIRSL